MTSTDALRHYVQCRICSSGDVVTVMRLESTPLEDRFVRTREEALSMGVYPLELALCRTCGYVHLPYVVSPEASYTDYAYVSTVTVGLGRHYDEYAESVVGEYRVSPNGLAVDLGSNDGSMLSSFKRLGMRVVGVEPAERIAQEANTAELPTIPGFFTTAVADHIMDEYGQADVVTANYVYANIEDVVKFTHDVVRMLAPDGIFVVQTGYHPEQMKKKMFDYIYHEHFSYFSVRVLERIFSMCGLRLLSADKVAPKGGSIRVVAAPESSSRIARKSVAERIAEEEAAGIAEEKTYRAWDAAVTTARVQLHDVLDDAQAKGQRIVGFGASHSTTTLLHHFGLGPYLEYLIDDNERKHGLYSPGSGLLVHRTEFLREDPVENVLVLAWQHRDAILGRWRGTLPDLSWIVPLPELRTF